MTPQTHQPRPTARVLLFRPANKEVISLRNACARGSRVVAYRVDPSGLSAKLIFEHRRGQGRGRP